MSTGFEELSNTLKKKNDIFYQINC